jgi:general stress protein 26
MERGRKDAAGNLESGQGHTMNDDMQKLYEHVDNIEIAMMTTRRADGHLQSRAMAREWISVSGTATITRDREKIHELYAPDWKMWFPNEGDPRHGTKDDPRMILIAVHVVAAVFLEVNKPQPVVLFEMVKGWLTGADPEIGEMHHIGN